MAELKDKIKTLGQVYTPKLIVCETLNAVNYSDDTIIGKHVIDNSCGNGAFLVEIIEEYIKWCIIRHYTKEDISEHLSTYIHGIEIDKDAYEECIANCDEVARRYDIFGVKWDILNADALTCSVFDGKMDYVIGNPPYVRTHNLDDASYSDYTYMQRGMKDLYLAFFELGFRMLKENGFLCYITPNSWLTSKAAETMRFDVLKRRKMCLLRLIDFGHEQIFKGITTYSIISMFQKRNEPSLCAYYIYKNNMSYYVDLYNIDDISVNGQIILGNNCQLVQKQTTRKKCVSVKNGFATLCDSVFVNDNIPQSDMTLPIIKGSTGAWSKCFFPYDKQGKPLPEDVIFANKEIAEYLYSNKEKLTKGNPDKKDWWLYGRTQGLKDVYKHKLCMNNLIRDEKDLKIHLLKEGECVYSGLYILINDDTVTFDEIEDVLKSQLFVQFVQLLKKYKSGGYYTFGSKDVEQFLNYVIEFRENEYIQST